MPPRRWGARAGRSVRRACLRCSFARASESVNDKVIPPREPSAKVALPARAKSGASLGDDDGNPGKFLARLFETEALRSHVVANNYPEKVPSSDAEWEAFIRQTANISNHSVGTCRMGGAGAVVDPTLAVYGITGLRAVDASVMPVVVSGNTDAAVIMIAEWASEMIGADG